MPSTVRNRKESKTQQGNPRGEDVEEVKRPLYKPEVYENEDDSEYDDDYDIEAPLTKHSSTSKCICFSLLSIYFLVLLFVVGLGLRYFEARVGFVDKTYFKTRFGSDPLPSMVNLDAIKPVTNKLPFPPGKISAGNDDSVFFTFHSFHLPTIKVGLLNPETGNYIAYPDRKSQDMFVAPHAIEYKEDLSRLYILDHGYFAYKRAVKFFIFDTKTNKLLLEYDFDSQTAGLGTYFSDFRVSKDGKYAYIIDQNDIWNSPAVVVLNIEEKKDSGRILEGEKSLTHTAFTPRLNNGYTARFFYMFAMLVNVNTIGIGKDCFYFGPMNDENLYQILLKDLNQAVDNKKEISVKSIFHFSKKPISTAMVVDEKEDLYFTDLEHSSIVKVTFDRRPTTPKSIIHSFVRDKYSDKIKWIEDLSYTSKLKSKSGYLYITDSRLNSFFTWHPAASPPFYIYRIEIPELKESEEEK